MDYHAIFTGLMVVVGAAIGWHFRAGIAEADLREERKRHRLTREELDEANQRLESYAAVKTFYRGRK